MFRAWFMVDRWFRLQGRETPCSRRGATSRRQSPFRQIQEQRVFAHHGTGTVQQAQREIDPWS